MAEINNEIRATLAISQYEALVGTQRVLTLGDGRQVSVTIPSYSQHGQILRLPGPGPETLVITLAVVQENQPNSGPYPPYPPSLPPITPPPPPASGGPAGNYGSYQFSEYVPGAQIPYPAPTFPDSQSYTAYPQSPPLLQAQGQTLPAQPGQIGQIPLPTPATPPKRKRRALVIVYNLLIFLTLTIIVAGAFAYLFGSYVPTQEHLQATATAEAEATRVVVSQVTATAEVHDTATAQANATATVVAPYIDAYNKAINGNPTLNDPLNAPSLNNWDTNTSCTFKDNAYHVIENEKGYFSDCFAQASNFSNFAYQVQMSIVNGNAGGIAFRANSDTSQMYVFLITDTGDYDIYYYPSNDGNNARNLDSGTASSFTQGYNQANLLTVIAKGTNLDFYVNKIYLTSVQDSSAKSGQIALLADYRDAVTEVSYTQAKVWVLS